MFLFRCVIFTFCVQVLIAKQHVKKIYCELIARKKHAVCKGLKMVIKNRKHVLMFALGHHSLLMGGYMLTKILYLRRTHYAAFASHWVDTHTRHLVVKTVISVGSGVLTRYQTSVKNGTWANRMITPSEVLFLVDLADGSSVVFQLTNPFFCLFKFVLQVFLKKEKQSQSQKKMSFKIHMRKIAWRERWVGMGHL